MPAFEFFTDEKRPDNLASRLQPLQNLYPNRVNSGAEVPCAMKTGESVPAPRGGAASGRASAVEAAGSWRANADDL